MVQRISDRYVVSRVLYAYKRGSHDAVEIDALRKVDSKKELLKKRTGGITLLSWIIVIVAAVVVDQVSKILVIKYLKDIVSVELIPGVFRFTYVENRGAAFGMLSDNRWVFMIISTLAIGALIVYLWKFRPDSRLACLALSMIAGGGIGNMIDRVALGYVVDFIDFCAFPSVWMWVFNIADAFVCVGAGLLILWLIISMVQESREQKIKRMVSLYEDEPEEEQKD